MNNDPTTPLTHELVSKLAELDSRLNAYRANLAIEYRGFARELLRSVPENVSSEVERVIAESVVSSRFPSLGREFVSESSPAPSDPNSPRHLPKPTKGSPPPSAFPTGAGPSAGDISAFALDRDDNLQGVFTPNYLPLLEKSSSSSQPQSPASPTGSNAILTEMAIPNDSGEVPDLASPYTTPHIQIPVRPGHIRRTTDETTSSFLSDRSESRKRRSALRRSSSSSKQQSPRRVRFDFEGGEVLPTSSPQVVDAAQNISRPRSPTLSGLAADATVSLLGDGDEEPPPKKVSSSQALRALSRTPLDTGTVWTVVNPQSDEDLPKMSHLDKSTLSTAVSTDSVRSVETVRFDPTPTRPLLPVASPSLNSLPKNASHNQLPEREAGHDSDGEDESSDEEQFLSMKSKGKKSSLPQQNAGASPSTLAGSSSSHSSSKTPTYLLQKPPDKRMGRQGAEDEDDIFDMEGLSSRSRQVPKPSFKTTSRLDDEDLETIDEKQDLTPYGTPRGTQISAGVPIKLRPEEEIPLTPVKQPVVGSVGSYKGRPISMPVVVNAKVYDTAASLSDVHTFVGSVDGRTGVDDANPSSNRVSLTQAVFSGTPRSLTERMIMEDLAAQKRQ